MIKDLRNYTITENNLIEIGETIVIKALKTVASRSYGKLDYLYKSLLYDVYKRNIKGHKYSDAYDFVQTAICFLLEHLGKKLSDHYGKNKKGRDCNILYACYHMVDKEIGKYRKDVYCTCGLPDDRKNIDKQIEFEKPNNDYTVCDAIMEKMKLTEGEKQTLSCYMAGMSYCQTARFLKVDFSTIWRRKVNIKKKYLRNFEL